MLHRPIALTRGERWLAKAYKRLAGWCNTRGWKCSAAFQTSPLSETWRRYTQHEVFITDVKGRTVSIAFTLCADEAQLVDEGGIPQGFDAVTFDNMLEVYALASKPKHSKRQLEMFVCCAT